MIKELYYYLYRRLNDDHMPCRSEIRELLPDMQKSLQKYAESYLSGKTVEEVAKEFDVTTARVRACITIGCARVRDKDLDY